MHPLKLIHSDVQLAEFLSQNEKVSIVVESDGGIVVRRDDCEQANLLAYEDLDELITYLLQVRRYAARRTWVSQYPQLIQRVASA